MFYTLSFALVDRWWYKKFRTPVHYIRVFVILYAVNMLVEIHQAVAVNPKIQHYIDIDARMPESFQRDFESKIKYHTQQGRYHFNRANEITLFIPDADAVDKADALFRGFVAASMYSTDYPSLIKTLIYLLSEYGLTVYHQWRKIESHLMKSKVHFESADFFREMLYRDKILDG